MKLKLSIIVLSIITLILISGVNAQSNTTQQCSDTDDHLLILNISRSKYIDDVLVSRYTDEFPIYCQFGCDSVTQECSPDPFQTNLIAIGLVVFFIIIIFFIATRSK